MPTAMISGHLDLTASEFKTHYQGAIDNAIMQGCAFVVGDAPGADRMAQQHLEGKGVSVTVYHMFTSPRYNVGRFPTRGGYKTNTAKDAAMTEESDFDLAWVRPGKETSGTARNLIRRKMSP